MLHTKYCYCAVISFERWIQAVLLARDCSAYNTLHENVSIFHTVRNLYFIYYFHDTSIKRHWNITVDLAGVLT